MRSIYAALIGGALLAMGVNAVSLPTSAHADQIRKASQSEIEAYVAKSADLTKLSNGWSYKSNAKYGYKFSDGSMCVRTQSGSVSCTKIVTDGKKFYTISPDGTKAPFSAKG